MDHATTRGRVLVGAAGWELVRHPAAADVIWVRNRCYLGDYEPARWSSDGGRRQAFNMLPWDLPVTDKGLLVKHLSAVSEYDASAFVPSTFRLTEPQQRQAFVSAMAACKRREEDDAQGGGGCGTWILKRTDLSNGEGAQILPKPAEWACGGSGGGGGNTTTFVETHGTESWLVQRYIEHPLLLNGRKSELRAYLLVASLEPLLVFYHSGTVRLNVAPYVHDGRWGDDTVHITNTRRQLQAVRQGGNASAALNHGERGTTTTDCPRALSSRSADTHARSLARPADQKRPARFVRRPLARAQVVARAAGGSPT
eukprot:SAG25_NODE_287_length_10351_cov_22.194499_6_plen_312_part_00